MRGLRSGDGRCTCPGTSPDAPCATPPLPPPPRSPRPCALIPLQVPACGPQRERTEPCPKEPPLLRPAGSAPSAAHGAAQETSPSLGSDCAARSPPPPTPGRRALAEMGLSVRPLRA